jgi:hypothetical protein
MAVRALFQMLPPTKPTPVSPACVTVPPAPSGPCVLLRALPARTVNRKKCLCHTSARRQRYATVGASADAAKPVAKDRACGSALDKGQQPSPLEIRLHLSHLSAPKGTSRRMRASRGQLGLGVAHTFAHATMCHRVYRKPTSALHQRSVESAGLIGMGASSSFGADRQSGVPPACSVCVSMCLLLLNLLNAL